jgi:hypothetical protein
MHKKGITEEVAKKRSRKTVKHQRGIVGADLAAIAARRDQTPSARLAARQTAIAKAKDAKKTKEATKVRYNLLVFHCPMRPQNLNFVRSFIIPLSPSSLVLFRPCQKSANSR